MKEPSALSETLASWCHEEAPWESGFLGLMRALCARTPDLPVPGTAQRPSQERHRLSQTAQMAFSPREIANLSVNNDTLNIQLFGLGIWGPQGAMPLHLSELAWSRSEQHDDQALTDFVDMFHHRALSLFWRSWFISQDTASLDRKEDESFSFYVASLVGLDPAALGHTSLPVHAQLAASAHLIREARNPEGLAGALHYYFDIPVLLEEFVPQWIHLTPAETSRLGHPDCALQLGDGAVLGETLQDRQHKFRLTLGPLTLAQYMGFSPWGEDLPVLCEWVRNFTGYEFAWDVQLILRADEMPQATLNGSHQLGYASWLARHDRDKPVSGMSFEPEHYQF
ncbi:type VI secretion system baseplate subunit TssG [Lelliottia sp. JS-SCA-14]|uniref:type VI secretion system baseplate subunit TssG n=1 Tax=Lelliottia sp. JS-SCA-14 TaxID=3110110 RepID=UPI002D770C45|nr:type VI secretion system baseplate subunit TssG [Lelliottia sp. JS-SCA-14]